MSADTPETRWRTGEPWVRDRVDAWLATRDRSDAQDHRVRSNTQDHQVRSDRSELRILADGGLRQVVHLGAAPEQSDSAALAVKYFGVRRGLRGLRDAAKSWLGLSADAREWRALVQLRSVGVPCPEPLGRARRSNGESLIVQRYAGGTPLTNALDRPRRARRALLADVGRCIAQLHVAGYVHLDLHIGNILDTPDGPLLIDFQRARRSTSQRQRLRDLGDFDFSLAHAGLSRGDRICFRRAALSPATSADPDSNVERRLIRAVGLASRRRANDFYRSRTRRCLRPGGDIERLSLPGLEGLRVRGLSESDVAEAIEAHRALAAPPGPAVTAPIGRAVSADADRLLKRDHRAWISAVRVGERTLVVKEVTKTGLRRTIADAWRGSPARRQWAAAHGLVARRIPAAEPLAFVELRRFGFPVRSAILLEDLRRQLPLSELNFGASHSISSGSTSRSTSERIEAKPERLADALLQLLLRLHRTGVQHGDLQSVNIYVAESRGRMIATLIDLDGVRFHVRLTARQRLGDLAQLNASIAAHVIPSPVRESAFEHYAGALPFETSLDEARDWIIDTSLRRNAAWRGEGCGVSPESR